ncbi:MAG: acyl-CoA dehydratase activase-related protein [Lachnospiraceae bacterium]|nr:acyl-CoA dehydratase activase-related protein [Lachnospiraceae bacterium]
MTQKSYTLGIDIGSTTVKIALLDENNKILFSDYQRHFAEIQTTASRLIREACDSIGDVQVSPAITGSGGLTLARHLGVPFVQEVVAVSTALKEYCPKTDVAIELGGEDAKIIYFENGGVEQRMNGICAGGTGSFIDQMADLLQTDASGLNQYAKNYKAIYPIAARCGVFAKTDIQPLINDGATKEDLSASIFQSVCNQTISGLACGKPIRGYVAFLGGPLHFLDCLRDTYVRTLHLDEEHTIAPDNSHLFAAAGSAMNAVEAARSEARTEERAFTEGDQLVSLESLTRKLEGGVSLEFEVNRLDPLFPTQEDYEAFRSRQDQYKVVRGDLSTYEGNAYLGIDAGSTTTKTALISEDGKLLYSFYDSNHGDPLATSIRAIKETYAHMPDSVTIAGACSTGYGEALIKAALMLDEGEVETISHYYAAQFFNPDVDCILDIGGQDMKCIRIRDHAVDDVMLNEACSAGCGSFIENFATTLSYTVQDFAKAALFAEHPIDLGTRCTVFMNSKVKQAQKEGATVADISAGLAYSVIKNALYKVIKVSDAAELGKNIVVQGGTFYNDAVLRAFEKIAECEVIRPDIAGIMGAFGAALIAKERHEDGKPSTMLSIDKIESFKYGTTMTRCRGCTNSCRLTINNFSGGRRYISGNRCERGIGKEKNKDHLPNLYDYKYKRIFGYTPRPSDDAPRGQVGIPRVLNMYENYPLWFTFFTKLGYEVVLSPTSTHRMYELGIESIPSESECYPAKLAHGHVTWLLRQGVKFIFYPCIPYERNEFPEAVNHYNCPIVTSYAENIKNNVEELRDPSIRFMNPFLALSSEKIFTDRMIDIFSDLPKSEVSAAAHAAWEEQSRARRDIELKGEETLRYLEETGRHGIVLAGRPYHIDPEINHGIPELINTYGMAVLTEDSISHLGELERPLRVNDQWMYHTRLYAAANYIKKHDNLDIIQLNSFGCGVDAVTTDQVQEIMSRSGRIYTCLKIDEVSNLGSARIRIRSLLAAIRVRSEKKTEHTIAPSSIEKVKFTKEMRQRYTILAPQMSPIHFDLLESAVNSEGYNFEVLDNDNRSAIDMGLKYVNNDACYPSLLVIGQLMSALKSGKYDVHRTAVVMTQTGGGCRASNYVGFIRRALEKAGLGFVPVLSLNFNGYEPQEGFKMTPRLLTKVVYAVVFGDIMMKCLYRMRPYEVKKGSADQLHRKWNRICRKFLSESVSFRKYQQICRTMIHEFDCLPITDEKKPRVGIVGEILVKFSPTANNHLAELLEKEGAEPVVPDLLDFFQYSFYNGNFKADNLGFSKAYKLKMNAAVAAVEKIRGAATAEFKKSVHFDPPARISDLAKAAEPIVSNGNQTGEGWFLTGEMLELIGEGVPNIVCIQPFACLPNHIVGKGVIKEIRHRYPQANIAAVDYDPGASEVNQLNRIKLMLTTAQRNLEKEEAYI